MGKVRASGVNHSLALDSEYGSRPLSVLRFRLQQCRPVPHCCHSRDMREGAAAGLKYSADVRLRGEPVAWPRVARCGPLPAGCFRMFRDAGKTFDKCQANAIDPG